MTCKGSRGVSGIALLWPGGGNVCEVRSTEFSRVPQHAIRVSPHAHNRPSPGRAVKFATGDLHWPEPASGGNGWFWFPLVRVQPDSIQLCSNLDEEFGCFLAVEGNFFRPRFPRLGQCGLFSGGPQKSRRGFTTTTTDRTVPRDTTYDFRRGPSPIRRRTFLAWTQKKSLFQRPKKPKKSAASQKSRCYFALAGGGGAKPRRSVFSVTLIGIRNCSR